MRLPRRQTDKLPSPGPSPFESQRAPQLDIPSSAGGPEFLPLPREQEEEVDVEGLTEMLQIKKKPFWRRESAPSPILPLITDDPFESEPGRVNPCPSCDQSNRLGARFCANCGVMMESDEVAPSLGPPASSVTKATKIILDEVPPSPTDGPLIPVAESPFGQEPPQPLPAIESPAPPAVEPAAVSPEPVALVPIQIQEDESGFQMIDLAGDIELAAPGKPPKEKRERPPRVKKEKPVREKKPKRERPVREKKPKRERPVREKKPRREKPPRAKKVEKEERVADLVELKGAKKPSLRERLKTLTTKPPEEEALPGASQRPRVEFQRPRFFRPRDETDDVFAEPKTPWWSRRKEAEKIEPKTTETTTNTPAKPAILPESIHDSRNKPFLIVLGVAFGLLLLMIGLSAYHSLGSHSATPTVATTSGANLTMLPNLIGLSATAAEDALIGANLAYQVVSQASPSPVGSVIDQDPKASQVEATSKVTLYISAGQKSVAVPRVLGLTPAAAEKRLSGLGLRSTLVYQLNTTSIGRVIKQSPDIGSKSPVGSTVTLTIARGPENTKVPNLVGLLATRAQILLSEASLRSLLVYKASLKPANTVLSADPNAGSKVSTNTVVKLVISRHPVVKPTKKPKK